MHSHILLSFFFFFNDTATTEIYTLSLHDALPISEGSGGNSTASTPPDLPPTPRRVSAIRSGSRRDWRRSIRDRKSTRLNSSHSQISYAVFCLKKKNNIQHNAAPTTQSVTSPTRGC